MAPISKPSTKMYATTEEANGVFLCGADRGFCSAPFPVFDGSTHPLFEPIVKHDAEDQFFIRGEDAQA